MEKMKQIMYGVTDFALIRAAQLDRYAKDRDLARAWNLKEAGGTVALHRIAVVFHGGDVACCEEI